MRDPVLAGLLTQAELGIPITLLSAGTVVEGVTTSEVRWFDQLAAALEAPGTPAAGAMAGGFRDVRMAVELTDIAAGGMPVEHLHLVEAQVRSGGRLVAVGLWRVAVDAVDGWKLGRALPGALRTAEEVATRPASRPAN